MSTYSNRLQPAVRNLLQRVVRFFHLRSSCTTHNVGGRSRRTKITRKASDAAENLQLYRVVHSFIVVELIRFFRGALRMCSFT